ncbi:MAG: TAT-variant-translocated molybdopterin oxidoreductase [Verrucomicrobia bacterium]|nr:TAT-variant-translocated molybdopterin oxidoreductase [Verrucomicrobiota bacterium]
MNDSDSLPGRREAASRPGPAPRRFWRSLDELSESDEFWAWARREFPEGASELSDGVGRREFLRVMGAALAMAGLGACSRQPQLKIVPYVEQPEEILPDRPLFFSTAMTLGGFATGLLVRSNEGRPTKVEGNPSHPSSLGATGPLEQAAVLQVYDPDRSRVVLHEGNIETFGALLDAILGEMERQRPERGRRFRLLTGALSSPTLVSQINALRAALPEMKWHQWEPFSRWSIYRAAQLTTGQAAEPEYRLEKADVIIGLDYDFLGIAPDRIKLAKAFAARRRFDRDDFGDPNTLFVAEPALTITGSVAQARLPLAAREINWLTQSLGARLQVCPPPAKGAEGPVRGWLEAAVAALREKGGRSLVLAGPGQDAGTHALIHSINQKLGNLGQTVTYRQVAAADPVDHLASLHDLVNDLESGAADSVLVLGGNPVFTAPADFKLGDRLRRARFSLYAGLYDDETADCCRWHMPERHFLESWSDTRAVHGETSIVQPLIAPLYGGISVHQLLGAFLGQPAAVDYDIVRDYWRRHGNWGQDFEKQWRQVLSDGVIADTATPEINLSPGAAPAPGAAPPAAPASEPGRDEGYEVTFAPDPTLWDGQFANNAWLQELPKPFSKVTWGNPAVISPWAAQQLRVQNGDVIRLRREGAALEIPVWIQPGQAERTVTLYLGNGRQRAGRVGNGTGVNTYPLRLSSALWCCSGVQVERVGRYVQLAETHLHHSMHGRDFLRSLPLHEFKAGKRPEGREPDPERDETLYTPTKLDTARHQWGMSINLSTCIGCAACVIACQAENNIPSVGADQVTRGREMHWIRVDHYFEGDPANPRIYQQPVPCMHCETAPCELVCPVEAAVHSSDGLNQQVYNRCVGTRYCSNNCPYKVRRFNFLQYADTKTPSSQLVWNPQVTVRSRGVMEKCTYCIQRIRTTQIQAQEENRPIREGEIVPACAQACPAGAIVFGDVADPHSEVSRLKSLRLNYSMLGELNTRPRTTYLARVEWSGEASPAAPNQKRATT